MILGSARLAWVVGLMVTVATFSTSVFAQSSTKGLSPLIIPLELNESAQQVFKPAIEVRVGSQRPLPVTFDTGSVGLHLFAATVNEPAVEGAICSNTPVMVTYGSPARVTYSGVVCKASVNLGGVISTPVIQFALLTAVTYCEPGYSCSTPQENYATGVYGIFGAGIAPSDGVPNPLRTLPGAYGQRFKLHLNPATSKRSVLILAPVWNFGAELFPQGSEVVQSTVTGAGDLQIETYDKGRACVIVGSQNSVCPVVSFDTGNGIPFFHAVISYLPKSDDGKYVRPDTLVGITPRLGGVAVITLSATSTFAGEFPLGDSEDNLVNVSVQAFLGNDVTFDARQGVITVARLQPDQDP